MKRTITYKGKTYDVLPEPTDREGCEGCAFRTPSGGCKVGTSVEKDFGFSCFEKAVIFKEKKTKNERRKSLTDYIIMKKQ